MFANIFDSIFAEPEVSAEVAVLRVKTNWSDLADCKWEIKNYRDVDYVHIASNEAIACCVAGCKYPILTEGSFALLTESEVFGVVQHELSHLELKKYATERGVGESFVSRFKKDQLFEREVDNPVVEKFYNGDRSVLKSAVLKLVKAERDRVIRVTARKAGNKPVRLAIAKGCICFVFWVMGMLTSGIRFKN